MFRKTIIVFCVNVFILVMFIMPQSARGDIISVTPSLGITESYESNPALVYNGAEGRNAAFTTVFSPRISISSSKQKASFSGSYGLSAKYYTESQKQLYLSHLATLNMSLAFSPKTSLSLSEAFTYSEDSRFTGAYQSGNNIQDIAANNAEIQTGRYSRLSNTVRGSVGHKFSQKLSGALALSDRRLELESSDTVDTRQNAVGLTGAYALSSITTVSMSYGFSRFLFDERTGNSSIVGHSLNIGVSRVFSTLSANISAGAYYTPDLKRLVTPVVENGVDGNTEPAVDSAESGAGSTKKSFVESYDNLTWTANIGIQKSFQFASTGLSYSRGIRDSFGLSNEINISENVTAFWSQTFSESISGSFSAGYSKNRTVSSDRINYESYFGRILFSWKALQWMNVNVGYSQYQQLSNGSLGSDLARERAFLTINISPESMRF